MLVLSMRYGFWQVPDRQGSCASRVRGLLSFQSQVHARARLWLPLPKLCIGALDTWLARDIIAPLGWIFPVFAERKELSCPQRALQKVRVRQPRPPQ